MTPSATSTTTATGHSWLPKNDHDHGHHQVVDALCLGTGRFLRSVLVPALNGAGFRPAVIQTRGRSFLEYMQAKAEDEEQSGPRTTPSSSYYEVDTVLPNGKIQTDHIACYGAFSLGQPEDKEALVEWLPQLTQGISILGVGVTEAGLASKDTQVMKDLYDLLHLFALLIQEGKWKTSDADQKICIIDMDNIPNNGDLIRKFMEDLADVSSDSTMKDFLNTRVAFLNTMVDRITSQRPGSNGMVPRCEPIPAKTLVLLDPQNDLPSGTAEIPFSKQPGVVVRTTPEQLDTDINLKLRVANGTHTAIAHTLALLRQNQTDVLAPGASPPTSELFMKYLDALVEDQIIVATRRTSVIMEEEAVAVWQDWRNRLVHPHFGLSSFFITQNGPAKGGIRWGPTVVDLLTMNGHDEASTTAITSDAGPATKKSKTKVNTTVSLAFAYAALLRWLTPLPGQATILKSREEDGVFTGWLDGFSSDEVAKVNEIDLPTTVEYADGLRHNQEQGWYEFKCSLTVVGDVDCDGEIPLTTVLRGCIGQQPQACVKAVRGYMLAPQGGNLASVASSPELGTLIDAVAVLFSRMVAGDSLLTILEELDTKGFACMSSSILDGLPSPAEKSYATGKPLLYRESSIPDSSCLMTLRVRSDSARCVVLSEVGTAETIDLHTHLLPPTHGPLCLWGIDELLTYHYLVAELFMTAPADLSPEKFYAKTTQQRADIIWKALFLERMPVSEACRGVITTLVTLGLEEEVKARNLESIRAFYRTFLDRGEEGAKDFVEKVFLESGVKYAIMTNIPFDSNESQYWRGPRAATYSERFRSALRVDPLLAGDTKTIENALLASGYNLSVDGACQYLYDWIDTMKPEYLMASTPHDFVIQEGSLVGIKNKGVNTDAMDQPFAFVELQSAVHLATCNDSEDEAPSVINENSDFLGQVLMKVCEERDLPIALKIGAHRGVNPQLKAAGDGVVAFADAGMLGRLCSRFPKVRFLATFLSKNNQHEACVLASKFRNLHIYGCWWFCNNPSIIKEITTMRIEMLGTTFTAQHSDGRVIDQLIYKWAHSRAVIAEVMAEEVAKLIDSGWNLTRSEIRRDVRRLFGGSYEEFMAKSFQEQK